MLRNFYIGVRKSVFILLAVIVTSTTVSVADAQSIDVYEVPMQFTFDESRLAPPEGQQGFIYKNTTYLPLRFVIHSLNQAVDWDGDTSTVTIREPDAEELVEIEAYNKGNLAADTRVDSVKPILETSSIEMFTRKVTYVIEGKPVVPDSGLEGFIINSRLFVPLRFVSTSIGYHVEWDPKTYSVALQSPAYVENKLAEASTVIPTAPGGSGGVGAAKPSKSSILSATEAKLTALESSCQNSLISLLFAFLAEEDETLKAELKNKGKNKLSQCDVEFEAIISTTTSTLIANGYDTTNIPIYRAAYEAKKKAAADAYSN